uniref:Ovule protein n=1 Tax=Haemonchus contortus TaxID=6289 RepID=A0A7I4YRG7_HAECO
KWSNSEDSTLDLRRQEQLPMAVQNLGHHFFPNPFNSDLTTLSQTVGRGKRKGWRLSI